MADTGGTSKRDSRRSLSAAAKQRGRDLYDAFDALAGDRYLGRSYWGPAHRRFVLTRTDGATLASLKMATFGAGQLLTIGTAERYQLRTIKKPGEKRRTAIVDVASGETWCTVTGRHFNHSATTRLTRPDGTWIHYPVFGRSQLRTVMIAEDHTDAPLIYFRKVRSGRLRTAVEIVVGDHHLDGEDLMVVLAVGGFALCRYFERPSAA